MTKLHFTRLELTAFTVGATIMSYELVGSRIAAPYFGNSLYVWTNLIGIILASLSIGYYWGGKQADRSSSIQGLSALALISGLLLGLVAFGKEIILQNTSAVLSHNLPLASFVGFTLLLAPASFFLGAISPYIVKLKINSVKNLGEGVGGLSAVSTIGSIFGTFITGFVLIPTLGHTSILYLLSAIMLILGILLYPKFWKFSLFLLMLTLTLQLSASKFGIGQLRLREDLDTLYNRILIFEAVYHDRPIITLQTDNQGSQSAVYLDSPDELVFRYTNSYRASDYILAQPSNALMIGGAGYTYPSYFAKRYPNASIDILEIDGRMAELATEHLFFRELPNMDLITAEARSHLRTSNKKYDVIFLDAFQSVTPPFHLTTREFHQDLHQKLKGEGILLLNLISPISGENNGLLASELLTLSSIYREVEVYQHEKLSLSKSQNVLVIAADYAFDELIPHQELALINVTASVNTTNHHLLTDDFAPVEYLTRPLYHN